MKGLYTKQLLESDIHKAIVYSYMEKLINNSDIIYNQFTEQFNSEGEFIYRAVHGNTDWGCDKYDAIEMCVNDTGVFVNGKLNPIFSQNHLSYIQKIKQSCLNYNTPTPNA